MFGSIDALLSLPIASVILLPSMTSYSTSLNVLFFYLTWSSLLLSHSQLRVEFLGTLFIRTIFYLLPSYFFLFFDASIPSVAASVKEHGDFGIATSAEHGGIGRRGRWWKVALVSTVNVVLSVAIQTGIEWLLTSVLHVRSALKISTSLPLPWAIIKDVARGFLMRELLTYLLHRYTLHASRSPLKTLHAKWYHSLPSTYSMMAHYDHPLPYLLRVFLPTYLPAAFFRFHLLTYHAFLALISLEELFVHSGYSMLPSGFILGGMARRQEKHLMGGGRGNYSPYGLADLLAGTSVGSDLLEDFEDEAEKKDVSGKAKRVGRKAKGRGGKIARQLRDRHEDEE